MMLKTGHVPDIQQPMAVDRRWTRICRYIVKALRTKYAWNRFGWHTWSGCITKREIYCIHCDILYTLWKAQDFFMRNSVRTRRTPTYCTTYNFSWKDLLSFICNCPFRIIWYFITLCLYTVHLFIYDIEYKMHNNYTKSDKRCKHCIIGYLYTKPRWWLVYYTDLKTRTG